VSSVPGGPISEYRRRKCGKISRGRGGSKENGFGKTVAKYNDGCPTQSRKRGGAESMLYDSGLSQSSEQEKAEGGDTRRKTVT